MRDEEFDFFIGGDIDESCSAIEQLREEEEYEQREYYFMTNAYGALEKVKTYIPINLISERERMLASNENF